MTNLKSLSVMALVATITYGAITPQAMASGGGSIVLLPIIAAQDLFATKALNLKLSKYGFKHTPVHSLNKKDTSWELVNEKADAVYEFVEANNLQAAKEACSKLTTGRLATPAEILKLAPIRSLLPDLSKLITDPNNSQNLVGYIDSAQDRFSININTKAIETFNKDADEKKEPAVCILKYSATKVTVGEFITPFTNIIKELPEIIKESDKETRK